MRMSVSEAQCHAGRPSQGWTYNQQGWWRWHQPHSAALHANHHMATGAAEPHTGSAFYLFIFLICSFLS